MKEYLLQLAKETRDPLQVRNRSREYLQARMLVSLQQAGAMIPLAFHGGTALRFLYGLRRFSEDLDFSLERQDSGYDLRGYLRILQRNLTNEGYEIAIKVSDQKTVHSAFLAFTGLPHELGISSLKSENLSIKIEVDTNPPQGVRLETTIVRHLEIMQLQHHDRGSLLAGKLHALLQRRYTKGRDLYDLLWYLSDATWPAPNMTLLRNALQQTGYKDSLPDKHNWNETISRKLEVIDWTAAVRDVLPFLEDPREADLLTKKNLMDLLDKK